MNSDLHERGGRDGRQMADDGDDFVVLGRAEPDRVPADRFDERQGG